MATSFQLLMLKIPVSDIARSATFYRDALGFEELFAAPEYGWAQYQAGDLSIALYQPGHGGGESAFGGDLDFHLQTDDLVALVAQLKAHSADIGDGIVRGDDNWDCIAVRDPDGNVLKIFGPEPEPNEAQETV